MTEGLVDDNFLLQTLNLTYLKMRYKQQQLQMINNN